MAVRIRLRRMGRKKQPHYRIVVADSKSPRDGRFVETLGYYKPLSRPARVVLDVERYAYWVDEGATPSDTVRNLFNKVQKGGDEAVVAGEADPTVVQQRVDRKTGPPGAREPEVGTGDRYRGALGRVATAVEQERRDRGEAGAVPRAGSEQR